MVKDPYICDSIPNYPTPPPQLCGSVAMHVWNQYLIPIPLPVCAAPVQGLAGPSRLILLSFPVPAWRRDLPDRHGLYLMPCVLLQVRWMAGLPDGRNTLSSSPSLCVPRQYRVLLDHHGLYCPFQCRHGAGICRTGTAFTWCPACCYRSVCGVCVSCCRACMTSYHVAV